jgi:hypothetical protein
MEKSISIIFKQKEDLKETKFQVKNTKTALNFKQKNSIKYKKFTRLNRWQK